MTFSATDACGNTATATRTVSWTVDTTAPVISVTGHTATLGCNPTASEITAAFGTATASDGCSGTASVTATPGTVSSNGCSRSQTMTFSATDACGNTATATRTVSWTVDTTAPVITVSSTPLTGSNCVAPTQAQLEAALGSATASDNCGNVTVTASDGAVQGQGCYRSQTRTFTSTDDCGNTATETNTVSWTVPIVVDCYSVCVSMANYDQSSNTTTFRFRVCANECPNALSYIAFIIGRRIGVVSPVNGSVYNYPGDPNISYRVSVPISNKVNGIKFETIGEGIRNACDIFEFTLAGNQTQTPINIEIKAGNNTYNIPISNPSACVSSQTNGTTALSATSSSSLQSIGEAEGDLRAYPTPFSDKATIEFTTSVDENYTVRLYDMKGALVKELKSGAAKAGVVNQVEVDGRSLPEGLYLGRVVSDSGSQTVKLLLKR
ncbi:T9SS type A sorting domain-containing protein [Pontibacter sp. SD6]|uniref:T9SS type A sorting domain-containing protein n=2 Tax=Pontibacter cellulosilyticus TaxID=1720253 RepID=A0A923N9Q3_9BACT|nr:T9SS type A sorting domain-containing protein [Pontibacter cellulosilyticus]